MSPSTRKEILASLRNDYKSASAARKSEIIDALQEATGYHRKYAIALLTADSAPASVPRKRKSEYRSEILTELIFLWKQSNQLSGKRLASYIELALPLIERGGHLVLSAEQRELLLKISPAQIDRLLAPSRKKSSRSLSFTKSGAVLRKHLQIKTFAEWVDTVPGFVEIDTVSHDGGNVAGQFAHTLTVTDVASCWTEILPLSRKCDDEVLIALKKIEQLLPFPLLGIDSDNGSEFVNYDVIGWAEQECITFTRSRPYKKNDQCYVEEKNGSVVRRLVGRLRYSGQRAVKLLNRLYSIARLYVNYLQPCAKLERKEEIGPKTKRTYDRPQTPCQRLLAMDIPEERKHMLREQFDRLDPVALILEIRSLQEQLRNCASEVSAEENEKPKERRINSRSTLISAIMNEFRNAGPDRIFTAKDFAQYEVGERKRVKNKLQRLYEKGAIKRTGRGQYQKQSKLTPVGKTQMASLRKTPNTPKNSTCNGKVLDESAALAK